MKLDRETDELETEMRADEYGFRQAIMRQINRIAWIGSQVYHGQEGDYGNAVFQLHSMVYAYHDADYKKFCVWMGGQLKKITNPVGTEWDQRKVRRSHLHMWRIRQFQALMGLLDRKNLLLEEGGARYVTDSEEKNF